MGIGKIGTTIGKEIIVWTRTSNKSLLASRPVKINTRELKYVPKLEGDLVQISKNSKIIIPEDKQLFPWATKKPALTFDNINPESLVLVRMTNEFPEMGEILSQYARKNRDGLGFPRTTVHFTLNRSVKEDLTGLNWTTMDYAIISPFSETLKNTPVSKVVGGIQEDFMFLDKVKLPKDSIIVKYNPNIPAQELCVSEIFDGIRMVESSNRNIAEVANLVVEKMGYTTSDNALAKFLSLNSKDRIPLFSKNEESIRRFIRNIEDNGGIKKLINSLEKDIQLKEKIIKNETDEMFVYRMEESLKRVKVSLEQYKTLEKYYDKLLQYSNSWTDFCKKNNFINQMDSEAPYQKFATSISLIDAVELLNKNSWGKDYKQRIINILNEALKSISSDKELCIDYKKVKKIIEESKTPQEAVEIMRKEFKIKSSKQLYKNKNLDDIFEINEIDYGINRKQNNDYPFFYLPF